MKVSFVLAAFLCAFSASAEIPKATCIPAGNSNWPVQAIYLHGWFKAEGAVDDNGFRRLEMNNRKALLDLANTYGIRIAAPLGPDTNSRGMRRWGNSTLAQIETAAKNACGVSSLPEGRMLLGFSNGGFKARDIGMQPCDQLQEYSKILAIGTQQAIRPRCNGKFVNVPPHVFPPDDLDSLLGIAP